MKKILITGNAGLIGSRLADYILDKYQDCTVIGIDNLSGGYIDNINPKVRFYKRDLSRDDISDIFEKEKIDYVFHFAAYAAEGLSPFIRRFNYSNNILSTVNIINNCINYNVNRLIYTSSMSVYGHGSNKRFDEDDIPSPIDPYGISKYACEMDIKVAGEQHGLDWCIIRPHNVYGIKQNIWDVYRNVLGIWMYKSLQDEPMLIYGDGEQVRSFSYVDDCLECFWNAAILPQASKQIINLGGTQPITINEACQLVSEITGNRNIQHKEARHEVKYAVPTYKKSMELLNYSDRTLLEDGLTKMWEWAKIQPDRTQFKWNDYEITKGLYSFWK